MVRTCDRTSQSIHIKIIENILRQDQDLCGIYLYYIYYKIKELIAMTRKCAVCDITNVTLHKLPSREEIRKAWIKFIKSQKGLSWEPGKSVFVCPQHFVISSYRIPVLANPVRIFLKLDAVPSIPYLETVNTVEEQDEGQVIHNIVVKQEVLTEPNSPMDTVQLHDTNQEITTTNKRKQENIIPYSGTDNTVEEQDIVVKKEIKQEVLNMPDSPMDIVQLHDTIREYDIQEITTIRKRKQRPSTPEIDAVPSILETDNILEVPDGQVIHKIIVKKEVEQEATVPDPSFDIVQLHDTIQEYDIQEIPTTRKRKQGHSIPEKRPRIGKPRFVGDIKLSDFTSVERAKQHWDIALKSIENLRKQNKVLRRKCQRYQTKITHLESLLGKKLSKLEQDKLIPDDVVGMINVHINTTKPKTICVQ